MPPPTPLAVSRFKTGTPAYRFAAAAQIHPTRWSLLEHGRVLPTVSERRRIVKVLGLPEEVLFPDEPRERERRANRA